MPNFKLIISKQREDSKNGLNQQLQFLGKSLGLFRDVRHIETPPDPIFIK